MGVVEIPEFRKLINFGKTSYVISLPKNWIERNKLKKGDTVVIEEFPDRLIITLATKEEKKESMPRYINIDNKPLETIRREIFSAYLNNYSPIILRGNHLKRNSSALKKMLSSLLALEVINHDAKKIVAKDYLDLENVIIVDFIKKIDMLIKNKFKDMIDLLKKDAISKLDQYDFAKRDEEVNRLYFTVKKILIKAADDTNFQRRLALTPRKMLALIQTIELLETIGDLLKDLIKRISTESKASKAKFRTILEMLYSYYNNIMKLSYIGSIEKILEIMPTREKILKALKKISSSGETRYLFEALLRAVHHLARTSFDYGQFYK